MKFVLLLCLAIANEIHAFDVRRSPRRTTSLSAALSRRESLSVAGFIASSLCFPGSGKTEIPSSISPCPKPVGNSKVSCVSTAAVRQVDSYMSPWTYPPSMPLEEVMGRLKGVVGTDMKLKIVEQGDNYLRVEAIRNFSVDEIEFLVNSSDNVITFISKQTDGPEVGGDFGANRKRLDDLRKRTGVFNVMGQEYARESALGQLKAFYGLQSGAGFEEVLEE